MDIAWHVVILMTREYQSFCDEAFGYYLHHSPEETMDEAMPATLSVWRSVEDALLGLSGGQSSGGQSSGAQSSGSPGPRS